MSAQFIKTAFGIVKNDDCATKTAVCDQHGDYEAKNVWSDIWSECPTCVEENKKRCDQAEAERQKALEQDIWLRKVGKAGIPDRFYDRTLETFDAQTKEQRDALEFAKQYAEDLVAYNHPGKCVVFAGRPGTGKTHLAVGIGLKALKAKASVLFITTIRMMRRIKETWGKDHHETETQAIKLFTFPELLILDEVGVQFGSDTEKLLFFDILNERYEQKKSTIFISNLTMDEIQRYLGERVIDRMREDGGELIPFMWKSHRALTSNP